MNLMMNLTIKRSKRRSTAIAIYPDLRVLVRAPLRASDAEINQFIEKHQSWIEKKLLAFHSLEKAKIREFKDGEVFSILGTRYSLAIVSGTQNAMTILDDKLVVCIANRLKNKPTQDSVRKILEKNLSKLALTLLEDRVRFFANLLEVKPKSVSVRNYKNKWGICKLSGDLVFNWRIILADYAIFDYVIVHELCHLIEFNHSPRFWSHVASLIPNYKEVKKELKRASFSGELELERFS